MLHLGLLVFNMLSHFCIGDVANLCIVDLDKEFEIKETDIQSKSINTPFIGVRCQGQIVANIMNGKLVEVGGF